MVDTGYFTADERNVHGKLRPDMLVKNDWVLRAYDQFPVDVINLSSHDLGYFSSLLSKTQASSRAGSQPLLNRLVSANTLSDSPGAVAPRPFVIREFPSMPPRANDKPLRVAFIGLTETTPEPPRGFKFIDPADAVRRALPEAKKSSDLVIVLAKVNAEEAARIAREAPGIDVIIAGNAQSVEQSFTPPFYVGQTLVVFTPFETRMLGELRVYRNPEGRFSTKQRFISMDEIIPDDSAAKQMVSSATKAEVDTQAKAIKSLEEWLAASAHVGAKTSAPDPARAGSSPAYVSSTACTQCHLAQYVKWTGSAHAHTVDRLLPRAAEFEAGCLDCHATGPTSKPGIEKRELALFQNVQCEACHGPGSDHVVKPGKGYGRIANMQTACASCHTPDTSPGFDLQAAWAKIKH